ncbi:Gfo/Idh/MocA family oxidoreductase [uncultured Roseobacter sp.]|uniref:Gfo/Idh/MocA family protein n=1 Tax=uncultured Roseobacter sp. TaxID=114847 RepID=UPI00261547EC|nr:Gfo/Idh/MocA family oxidoreductase [uncultured Roseobacter sp.]
MIRVAIVGAGIGAEHLAGYRALPDRFSVDVMCDLDLARAAKAVGADDSIRVFADLAAVLSNPEIDLVDICLPPHLHLTAVLEALAAGKHAICEKPLATSLADVDRIEATVTGSQCRVFPVFQYRYGRAMAQLKALRDAGMLGRPLVASAETHWNRGADYYATPWRGTWAGEAGGAILGHAIHAHDLLCHVMGPVATVSAHLATRVNDIDVDDCAAISMVMQSGALMTSSVTLGAARDTSRLRYCFEKLTAESGSAPYTPAEDVWTFTARGDARQQDVDRVIDAVPVVRSGFEGFLEAVADALEGRAADDVSLRDARQSVELVTALYTAARETRLVRLPLDKTAALYGGWVSGQAEE